jgi:hypothetical protein
MREIGPLRKWRQNTRVPGLKKRVIEDFLKNIGYLKRSYLTNGIFKWYDIWQFYSKLNAQNNDIGFIYPCKNMLSLRVYTTNALWESRPVKSLSQQ